MKGSTEPRIYTPPLGELTEETSYGKLFCEFAHECGIELLPWQEWLAWHLLELHEGMFRYRTAIVLVARQNGKTTFLKLLNLFFIYVVGGDLAISTAQNLDASEEVWEEALELAENSDNLAPMIDSVVRQSGKKALTLTDGNKYRVVAATRKAGRGKSADLVSMDEAREQTDWDAWAALDKTTMSRPNALTVLTSNAGDSKSVVLRSLRKKAHAALGDPDGVAQGLEGLPDESDTPDSMLGIFEWSAEPDCEMTDKDGWAQANPSLGYGFLTERALTASCTTDPEDVFRTECLCQWVEAVTPSAFPEGTWDAGLVDTDTAPDAELFWGIDMDADRTRTAIAYVGRDEEGNWHGEVEAYRVGFDWALRMLKAADKPMRIALQGRGAPISSQIEQLEDIEGLEIVRCEGPDLGAWTGRFYDAIAGEDTKLTHIPQPALDEAAAHAAVKPLGEAWTWDRKKSDCDVSPLMALTMAYGLATSREKSTTYESAYAERGMLTL